MRRCCLAVPDALLPGLGVGLGLALILAPLSPAAAQQVIELPAHDRPLDLDVETLWSVGSLAGAPWETFGNVSDAAFDASGNLYILDSQASRVVVVDPSGRFRREVGRAGDGPGELRAAAGLAVLRDGTVAIADMGHRAFVVYGSDGAFLHQTSFADGDGIVVLGELLADPRGGSVISAGRRVVSFRRAGRDAPTFDSGRPVVRYELDADGGRRTLFQAWEPPPATDAAEISVGGTTLHMPVDRAFEPELFAGVLPDGGVVWSDSSAYAVKVGGPDGRPRRVLVRPIEPRETTERIRDAEKQRRLAELEAGEGPRMSVTFRGRGGGAPRQVPPEQVRDMMRQRLEGLTFYPEVPVVQELATGWDGTVWLRRRGEELFGEGPVDLLDPVAGTYLGTLAAGTPIPDAFGPGGLVAYIVRDELDVPSVRVALLPDAMRRPGYLPGVPTGGLFLPPVEEESHDEAHQEHDPQR